MIPTANGPIDKYCQAMGCSTKVVDQQLKAGDTGMTIMFAAEVLYGLLSTMNEHLEVLEMSSDA